MFLRLFKSQHPFIIIFAVIILFVLWLGSLINYDQVGVFDSYGQSILFERLVNIIGTYKLLYFLIPIFSIIIQLLIIIRFNTRFILYDNRTFLPALLYVVLSSSIISIQGLYPVFIAAPIVLYSIYLIFSTFRKNKPFSVIFLSSFILAISSMFFHFTIYFLGFIWISLFIIRTPSFREISITLLGVVVPYILLLSYFFVFDDLSLILNGMIAIYDNIPSFSELHYSNYIFLGIVILLFLVTMLFSFNGVYIKKIDSRKFFKALIVFLFFTILLYIVFPLLTFFILISIPLSFLIAIFFLTWKNRIMSEILLILLLLSILFIQVASYMQL